MTFTAELQRKTSSGYADWEQADDVASPTGVADPVADYEARTSLSVILTTLTQVLSALQDTLAVALSQGQIDQIKPLATQPVSGSVAVTSLPAVTVTNPTANPETGLAKDTTVAAVRDKIPALAGDGGLPVHLVNPVTQPQVDISTLAKDATSQIIANKLPAALDSDGGVKVHVQNPGAPGASESTLQSLTAWVENQQYTRLGDILTALGNVKIDADSINLNTDTLEALLGTSNTLLTGIGGNVDGVEGLLSALNGAVATAAKQDTLAALVATEATLANIKNKFAPNLRTTSAKTISSIGVNDVIVPTAGKALRVHWVGMSASQNNGGENFVIIKIGTATKYRWNMGNPGAFSHWEVLDGAVGEKLTATLTSTDPVEINYTYEEV